MGQRMVADYTVPVPHPVRVYLVCDGDHGLLDPPKADFDVSEGDPRHPAVAAGWVYTGDGPVLCPECARRPRIMR